MNNDQIAAVGDFLFHEAHLLDERRFDQWLSLFDPEGYYWMPCDRNAIERKYDSAIINDDMAGLKRRVIRLGLASAHADFPKPLATRVISNVAIESEQPLIVRAKLVMHEFQRRAYARDDYRVFCATLRYQLKACDDGYRIGWKRVDLVDAVGSRTVMPTPL